MKVNKKIVIGGALLVVLLVVAYLGIMRDFDARSYTRAILNQHFSGDVAEAAKMIKGTSEEELSQQYEDRIRSFVETNVTVGVEMDEEMQEKYVTCCKEIFADMEFEVQEAEKISREEYKVPVSYKASDVFEKYHDLVSGVTEKLLSKAEKGEYKGSLDEIKVQIQKEFLDGSYEALEAAYDTMEYAEAETMTFTVKKDESGAFGMNADEIKDFTAKIMKLDEIPD